MLVLYYSWWDQSVVYTTKQESLESRLQKSLPQTLIRTRNATAPTTITDTINPLTGTEGVRENVTENVHRSKSLKAMTNQMPMNGRPGGRKTRGRETQTVSSKMSELPTPF